MSATNLKNTRVRLGRGRPNLGYSMLETSDLIVNSTPDLPLKVPLERAS